MQVYTDEFIEAMEKIENNVEKAISDWINKINLDSMIESRNILIGDSNEFLNGFFVNAKTHKIDISNEINLGRRNSIDDISKAVCKKALNDLQELIEKKIEESTIPVNRARDVRKIIKVAYEGALIELNSLTLCLKIGIEEYKKTKD